MKARVTFFLPVFLALLLAEVTTVRGQSALDGFDPNADESVLACVVQPDGKVLVGGGFTSVLGVPRRGLARLNPDGTLDVGFNASATWNANASVYAIRLQADGKILISGSFTTGGAQSRHDIARLDPTTGTPDSFNANTDNIVYAIVLQADGKILVVGAFKNIGGQARNYIARLDPITGVVDSFNPNATAGFEQYIQTVAVQRDGKILVGGAFSSIGGQTRNCMARLDPVTGLADSFNPNPNSVVLSIVAQQDGRILVGGNFSSIGGQGRSAIARLDPVTGLADSFNPGANGAVRGLMVQPDGKILVGGGFFGTNSIGGQARSLVARLDPVTGLADSFDPNANQAVCCSAPFVYAFAVQADGKVLVGGDFIGMAPKGGPQITRNHVARMEKDGFADQTLLDLNITGQKIVTAAVQPDGKLLVGGAFNSVLGVQRNNIARLNTNGSLDLGFDADANGEVDAIAVEPDGYIMVSGKFTSIGQATRNYVARINGVSGGAFSFTGANANDRVNAMAVQSDGKVLLGGAFTNIGGQNRNHIARLDPISGLADAFDPNADGAVNSIVVQGDGKILVGGNFHQISGVQRACLARLNLNNGWADTFAPQADGAINSITVQSDGSIVITGDFAHINGQPRAGMARLNGTTGALDPFDANPDGPINSLVIQSDGKITVGGKFSNIGGAMRNRLARLDGATGAADSYDVNADNGVEAIALPADGKVLVGGEFTNIGGQSRNLFARLTNDTPALQDLNTTPSTITWSRGGANVQVSRVTFEYSTDNANYTLLGNGTFSGNAWTVNNLNLPNAQNFYIRARGFYRSGENNGSESIAESVRNVFLREVSVANIISRKVHGGAGAFDINLPRSGNNGIECRSGGASGNYQLVFSFANPITSVGNASVTNGTGNIASRMIDTDAHNYIVNLTGVTNAQTINVSLTNVNDNAGNSSSSVSVPMAVLIADVSGNGSVNASDISQTKTNSGALVDGTNFRSDVNANGSINASDVSLVKSQSGTSVSTQAPIKRKTL